MQEIIYDLELDFMNNRTLQTIKVKQFENLSRRIRLNLYNNGRAVSFSGLESAAVNASVNGAVTVYDESCTITSSSNIVQFRLSEAFTTLAGTEHCEVKIKDGSIVLYTATFNLEVEPSAATSESPEILATTELAAVLKDHEKRITNLESNSGSRTIGQTYGLMKGISTSAVGEIELYRETE